jgi:hypothetical protein
MDIRGIGSDGTESVVADVRAATDAQAHGAPLQSLQEDLLHDVRVS